METEPVDPSDPAVQAAQITEGLTTSGPARPHRPSLLPEALKQPLVLLWVALLPQLVLLLLNLRDYQLISGELQPAQRSTCILIGLFQVGLIAVAAGLAAAFRLRGRNLPWFICWALLLAPILFLWFFSYKLSGLIPPSVAAWMLPPDQVLYNQFALMMPLIFYAAVRLSCADFAISRLAEYGTLIGAILGIPICLSLLIQFRAFNRFVNERSIVIFVVIGLAATLLVLAAGLRLLVILYVAVRRQGPVWLAILAFVVGIAGPIGGLLLDRKIPFPADFQTPLIYALALTNGLLLLLPNFRQPFLHRLVWLAQCALFPFTLYFFLVFLPFLPLSILAIGVGFLILTPTALFLVHGQRLLDGYRAEIRDGPRWKPALLGLLAFSVLPCLYTFQAGLDRVVLRQAIDYVYSPDYRTDTHFTARTAWVRRSLDRLRDFKAGANLPFISRYYNWIVFDGLVLPDDKMNYIHRAFFGEDLPAARVSNNDIFGAGMQRGRSFREATLAPPNEASIAGISTATNPEGDCTRATISIDVENATPTQSGFVTPIHMPEGVLVSGFWLHIGDQRVPGQLFEKKSALWVYQMITNRTRRDPGLLLYTGAQTLELRVFPVEPRQHRHVEIEFLYPTPLDPTLQVGDKTVSPSGPARKERATVLARAGDGVSAALFSEDSLATLPAAPRIPYLHFIVDRSRASELTEKNLLEAVQAVRAQFPQARDGLITLANYETADLLSEPASIDAWPATKLETLPRRGAFLPERAIKSALLHYHDALNQSGDGNPWFGRFPIFVIVHSAPLESGHESDLSACGGTLEAHDFTGARADGPLPVRPVALLKSGNAVAPCAIAATGARLVNFNGLGPQTDLLVLDAARHTFVPLTPTQILEHSTRYAAGISVWQEHLALIYNPSLGPTALADIVKRSRESGIMVGSTSYIVVENSAQWKILERKQKQKLNNSLALEINDTPEPATWCLIVIGSAFLLWAARKRAKPIAR